MDITLSNIAELRKAFDPKLVNKALNRAIKTASDRVATQISRTVREKYKVKLSVIKDHVTLRPIIDNGVINRIIAYTGGRMSMRHFVVGKPEPKYNKRTGLRQPVRVTIRKDRPRRVLKGAFIARGKYHREDTPLLVFKRKGKKRLKIMKLTTLSVATMVANKSVIEKAVETSGAVMEKEFTRQMGLLMDKTGAL